MHPRLQELMTYLDAQRANVFAAAGALPAEQWTDRPAPDAWSVVHVLEHLRLVESGVARLVLKLGKEARARGTPAETSTTSVLGQLAGALDGLSVIDGPRGNAPEGVQPADVLAATDMVEALERTREELYRAVGIVDGLALEELRWRHALLGELNLYQWLLFVGQHEARHARQIARMGDVLQARQSGGAPLASS